MSSVAASSRAVEAGTEEVLPRLERVMSARQEGAVVERLAALRALVADDLSEVEEALHLPRPSETPAHLSARHLLSLEGKRLRPMCVALAARAGSGFGPAARDLAIAVELVHNATLLHDDVVDLGDRRRGSPTARIVYGNAASIYAGDYLLVEALERVRASGIPELLDRAFAVLKEMLDAESLQLANRGIARGAAADYFRIVEGKTASLFGWALYAGGRAGGSPPAACEALERYGRKLGVAFQVVDDVLDVAGASEVIGKTTFADLREGKITYPVIVALEKNPGLLPRVEEACARDGEIEPDLCAEMSGAIAGCGAVDQARALATTLAADAVEALSVLPEGPAREGLAWIAAALPQRRS